MISGDPQDLGLDIVVQSIQETSLGESLSKHIYDYSIWKAEGTFEAMVLDKSKIKQILSKNSSAERSKSHGLKAVIIRSKTKSWRK